MSEVSNTPKLSLWTIGSIAIVAYCLTNILHEGLGHGGACLLLGGRPVVLNAIFFKYDTHTVSPFGHRLIAAGGPVINFITGGIVLAVLRSWKRRPDSLRYFLWLFSAINLLMGFGYLLFSGVTGIGDWIIVADGFAPLIVVRLGLTLIGVVLYFTVTPKLLAFEFGYFLDNTRPLKPQIQRLTKFPYVIGGATFLIAGLLNPYGLKYILISAVAASFGGTALLAFDSMSRGHASSATIPLGPFALKTQLGWIIAGVITLLIFVGILGPGINFRF